MPGNADLFVVQKLGYVILNEHATNGKGFVESFYGRGLPAYFGAVALRAHVEYLLWRSATMVSQP
ncbi:hypothetical protein BDV10DRAFT_163414 [Aspergillus recurvatus]